MRPPAEFALLERADDAWRPERPPWPLASAEDKKKYTAKARAILTIDLFIDIQACFDVR
jgi:hypothetical protein